MKTLEELSNTINVRNYISVVINSTNRNLKKEDVRHLGSLLNRLDNSLINDMLVHYGLKEESNVIMEPEITAEEIKAKVQAEKEKIASKKKAPVAIEKVGDQ
jgi:hypothetical protein